jgi:hypothetical protein
MWVAEVISSQGIGNEEYGIFMLLFIKEMHLHSGDVEEIEVVNDSSSAQMPFVVMHALGSTGLTIKFISYAFMHSTHAQYTGLCGIAIFYEYDGKPLHRY